MYQIGERCGGRRRAISQAYLSARRAYGERPFGHGRAWGARPSTCSAHSRRAWISAAREAELLSTALFGGQSTAAMPDGDVPAPTPPLDAYGGWKRGRGRLGAGDYVDIGRADDRMAGGGLRPRAPASPTGAWSFAVRFVNANLSGKYQDS